MFSLLFKVLATIAFLVGAVIALVHLFPYLLILLALFGLVKIFQAMKSLRNPPPSPPPSRWL